MYHSVSQKLVLFYLGQLTSRVFGAAGTDANASTQRWTDHPHLTERVESLFHTQDKERLMIWTHTLKPTTPKLRIRRACRQVSPFWQI
jgi:hypothetical protein